MGGRTTEPWSTLEICDLPPLRGYACSSPRDRPFPNGCLSTTIAAMFWGHRNDGQHREWSFPSLKLIDSPDVSRLMEPTH